MDTTLLVHNLKLLKAVLPNVTIIHKDNDIIIDNFIFITHKKVEAKTLSTKKVFLDKYDVSVDTGEEDYTIAQNKYFRQAVLEAVKYHAGFKASEILEKIRTEEFAKEELKC